MKANSPFDFQSLEAAATRAALGKAKSPTAARYWLNLENELLSLEEELADGRWKPRPVQKLSVLDPKPREISVPAFRDRVVHQALAAVVEPLIERRLIKDTYACRRGAGTHAALRRARAWARSYRWVAHLDVKKYFPSIDHAIVKEQWSRDRYPCFAGELSEQILSATEAQHGNHHFPGDDLFTPSSRRIGLPLGSLMSQLWANRYLDPVDHLVKDRLRLRPYLRYMDDLVLFHNNRSELVNLARSVEEACWELRLRLHPWDIMPTADGLGFVGYRVLPDHVRVRRSTVNRAERRTRRLWQAHQRGELSYQQFDSSLQATFGHWSHADSWRLKERFLRRLGLFYDPKVG